MKEIVDITVNMNSKAIVVTYFDSETGLNFKEGYDPQTPENWDCVEQHPELCKYKQVAWEGLERPIVEEVTSE